MTKTISDCLGSTRSDKREVDQIWYDTVEFGYAGPFGSSTAAWAFGNHNIGQMNKTNLHVPGMFAHGDCWAKVLSLGMRVVGASQEQENAILDQIVCMFQIGDRPQIALIGPCSSILNHALTQEQLEETRRILEREAADDEGNPKAPVKSLLRLNHNLPGYNFQEPLLIPPRQHVSATVHFFGELPPPDEPPWEIRIYAFCKIEKQIW